MTILTGSPRSTLALLLGVALAAVAGSPAQAHHTYAMFDMNAPRKL